MSKTRKTSKAMWINPHSNIKRQPIEWDRRQTDVNNARYLELAEIALKPGQAGLQKGSCSSSVADAAG